MTQTFIHSRFSSGFLHHQPEKGFLTSRTQRRHARIWNGDKEFPFRVVSCHQNLDSAKNFSSSHEKPITTHKKKLVQTLGATSDGELLIQPSDNVQVTWQNTLRRKWDAFCIFSRPYSAICTIIGISSVSLLPLTSVGDFSSAYFVGLLQALIPFLCANIYTSAINQLVDVDIDKVNKPYLPLVSGEFSMGEGRAIVSALTFTCLAMAIMSHSAPLLVGVLVYFLIGTAYSVELPFLRWKTKPAMAAFSMAGLMGLTIQPAVFYHIQNALGKPMVFSRSVGFATIFFSIFAAVLGAVKDIPDVEGDREFGNLTFSVRYGQERVSNYSFKYFSTCFTNCIIDLTFHRYFLSV
ncbi:hypothetical protein AgCh_027732 [Apium graveolens]